MKTLELFAGSRSFTKVAQPRGSITGTQGLKGSYERSKIPPKLFEELFEQMGNAQLNALLQLFVEENNKKNKAR